jgi:hypothetical protein
MYSATTFAIRDARVADVPELVRLGWSTQEEWPSGQIIVGEIDGVVAVGLAIDENRAVTAAVGGAPYLLAHMRARAAGILAHRRTPSVAERIRERMHAAVAVDA